MTRRLAPWLFALPLLAVLALLWAYPTAFGFVTSFQAADAYSLERPWNGVDNYIEVIEDPAFWSAVLFTVMFTVVATTVEFVLGYLLALVFDTRFPGKSVAFTILLVPLMIAPALMGVLLRLFLNSDIGLGAALLDLAGIPIALHNDATVFGLLIALDALTWTSFTFLVIYSALQSVPREVLEAASVDGASYARTVWSIVTPQILPILGVAVFLRGLDAFRTFDLIYVLTGGGPGTTTTNLSIYIYKEFQSGDYGVASAAGVLVLLLLIPFVPAITRRLAS